MYKVSVPIINNLCIGENREGYLKQFKEASVDRVFLSTMVPDRNEAELFKENIEFFKKNGIEACIWIGSTCGHGVPLAIKNNPVYTNGDGTIVNILGNMIENTYCSLYEDFRRKVSSEIAALANTGVDTIMLDDDFRNGVHGPEICCACDRHMALIRKYCGENITREDLKRLAFTGKPNKYRDAFVRAQGDSLRLLATDIRAAVDKVNPNVRLTICSAPTLWEIEGTSAQELAKILAGKNQPEARLIGAPYWTPKDDKSFAYVVELERMLASWNKDSGVDVIAEGDAYPRPRHNVPAAYLELHDGVMRADGNFNGILKYMVMYSTNHSYEEGYLKKHIKNLQAMKQLEEIFADKEACGVYCPTRSGLICDADFTVGTSYDRFAQPLAGMVLGALTIPTTYSDNGICTALFGEMARHFELDKISDGAIVDGVSAVLLTQRGVDVGLCGEQRFATGRATWVLSRDKVDMAACLRPTAKFMTSDISEKAQVLSYANVDGNEIPLLYKYENEKGQKFVVFMADTMGKVWAADIYRHYTMQEAMTECVEWISGKKLPATCVKNPDLYMICKEGQGKLSVGLFNCFADSIIDPVIKLDREYTGIRFVNCSGRLEGDTVYLDDQIYAFEFAAFELS